MKKSKLRTQLKSRFKPIHKLSKNALQKRKKKSSFIFTSPYRLEILKLTQTSHSEPTQPLQPLQPETQIQTQVQTTLTSSNQKQPLPLEIKEKSIHAELTLEQWLNPSSDLQGHIRAFLLDQRSPHTMSSYEKDLKRFRKFLLFQKQSGKIDLYLNRAFFIAYKNFLLSEQLEHSTIDRHLATFRSLFKWLTEEEVIEKNPVERVRFLSPKKISKTQGFTDEEVRKVLKQPNLHARTGAQHYAILMILFYCGLRRSEICGLKLSNLFIEKEKPLLRLKGKGNKERIVPLIPAVWNAIRYFLYLSRKEIELDNYLFTPIRNNRTKDLKKALDPSLIFYIVRKYSRLAGILKKVSPHSCRATAISNARDHQVPDRAIQEFAGWESTQMIVQYDKRRTVLEGSAAYFIDYGVQESRVKIPRKPIESDSA